MIPDAATVGAEWFAALAYAVRFFLLKTQGYLRMREIRPFDLYRRFKVGL